MGTAIVLLVLCAIVGAVIYKMVKDKRSGNPHVVATVPDAVWPVTSQKR